MRVTNAAHEARPWVMGTIAPDFKLLDVWALPVEGGRYDFFPFLEAMADFDPAEDPDSAVVRALFRLRFCLGALLGWDDQGKSRPIPGCTETSLRARLPGELQGSAEDVVIGESARRAAGGFSPLYRTDDEYAAEISNDTVHDVLHVGWVEQGDGGYRAEIGVYVKPRGWLGGLYLLLIKPFRHLIVYPALVRQVGRTWSARTTAAPSRRGGER